MDAYREAISRSAADRRALERAVGSNTPPPRRVHRTAPNRPTPAPAPHPITPPIASADRVLVERMCAFARARYPAFASQVLPRTLYFLHTAGQVWHDCKRRTWHHRGEGTPRFLAECLHGRPPCRPPIGGLAIHAGRNVGVGSCHIVVLVQDLATRRTRSAESLRSIIAHENVHCALRQHLAPRERVRFLDWIAANVPYQHLRHWFGNRVIERSYRRHTGIDPRSVLLGGYIDTSPNPTLGGSRANVLHYIEEAFAARVDDALAGNPTPGARYPAERRLLAFARRLDRAALARNTPAGLTLKFN